jgi:adenine-specific DNA-methyltransferase
METLKQERLFNVGLELSITWINRILFLKLLEAQVNHISQGRQIVFVFKFRQNQKL